MATSLGAVSAATGAAQGVTSSVTGGGQVVTPAMTPEDYTDTYTDSDFLINAGSQTRVRVSTTGSRDATVHVTGLSGYPYPVSLSATVLPATPGITVTLSANPLSAGSGATLTISTRHVAAGTYVVTLEGTGRGGIVRTSEVTVVVG